MPTERSFSSMLNQKPVRGGIKREEKQPRTSVWTKMKSSKGGY